MIEVRFHGRGGQGAVTSAEMVALAAIEEGKFAQGFPSFGPERRGAPVVSFARVDDKTIRLRSKIYQPDVAVVLDPSLLKILDPSQGLKPGGLLIINTNKSIDQIRVAIRLQGPAGRGRCRPDRPRRVGPSDYQHDDAGRPGAGNRHRRVGFPDPAAEGPFRKGSGKEPQGPPPSLRTRPS